VTKLAGDPALQGIDAVLAPIGAPMPTSMPALNPFAHR
jgi:hypothetical protein